MPLAWLTVRADLPFQRAWLVVTALPLVIPTYVGAFAFVAAFGPRGLLQQALAAPFGIERLPEIYGFPGAWLALTLFTYPYVLLTVRAALGRLDPALEEAARGLGLRPWAVFWRVTLPQLRPAIAAGGLLVQEDVGAASWAFALVLLAILAPVHARLVFGPPGRRGVPVVAATRPAA